MVGKNDFKENPKSNLDLGSAAVYILIDCNSTNTDVIVASSFKNCGNVTDRTALYVYR